MERTFFFGEGTATSSMVHSSTLCDTFLGFFLSWVNNLVSKVNIKSILHPRRKIQNMILFHTVRHLIVELELIYLNQEVSWFFLLALCQRKVVLWRGIPRESQGKVRPDMDSVPARKLQWALQKTRMMSRWRELFQVLSQDHGMLPNLISAVWTYARKEPLEYV